MSVSLLEEWYNILNWNYKPNFDTCHRHENFDDFQKEYSTNENIEKEIKNIFYRLDSETSFNVKFMGKKGSGKTTFLHYIKRNLIQNKFSDKYFFIIIRAGRISLNEHELSLKKLFIEHVYKKFFLHSGLENEYNRILEKNNIIELTHQELQTYYFSDENIRFKKRLIVVLDDLDTLKNEQDIINLVSAFKRICGSGDKINKWVSIRETTFNSYTPNIKNEFTFFQNPITLPKVSLFEIIRKRIYAFNLTSKPINPFSERICLELTKLNDDSIRDSLGLLNNILSNAHIPEKKQSEEFIQNWLANSIPSILLGQGIVTNLHAENFISISNYPLAYDLLMIVKFEKDINDIFAILNKIANKRGSLFNTSYIIPDKKKEKAISLLLTYELILYNEKLEIYELTNLGKFISNMNSTTYNKICKNFCNENMDNTNTEYWDILEYPISYKDEVKDRYQR